MPLAALQKLSSQDGDVTSAHRDRRQRRPPRLDGHARCEKKLGTVGRRGVATQSASADTLSSLDNVKTIATYSLIGALVAGAVIIFLSMLMIVRERRREIGVLKAIGSSNAKISWQFVTEALTLTGDGRGRRRRGRGDPEQPGARRAGVEQLEHRERPTFVRRPGGGGPPAVAPAVVRSASAAGSAGASPSSATCCRTCTAHVGFSILLYGLLAAVLIAVVGTAIPSWLIAKVRPAEVMRTE